MPDHTDDADQTLFIYTTFPSLDEGERVASALVSERLAACVNLLPGMVSVYEWEGGIGREQEVAAIVKTRRARLEDAVAALKRLHPFSLPAIVVLPSDGGSAEFSAWVARMTGGW